MKFLALVIAVLLPLAAQVSTMPYSAEQISETVQTLADGTKIKQPEQKTKMYRDSQGRTRTERTFTPPPGMRPSIPQPTIITVNDPVGGFYYMFDANKKVARRQSMRRSATGQPLNGAMVAGGVGPVQIGNAMSAVNVAPPASGPRLVTEKNGVSAVLMPGGGQPGSRPEMKNESLGTKVIEGLLCDGYRNTTIYPTGMFGNDRPITAVSERWTSQELQLTVLSTNSDPRSGETTTKTTEINRAAPDPALFMVPPDYTVEDQTPPGPPRQ